MKTEIYTHDEAMLLIEMFEDILVKHNIRVPSPEDEEREPDDVGLYGSTYSDLFDGVEERIIDILERVKGNSDCPFGGDVSNDCQDCTYSGDYHYENGECVQRRTEAEVTKYVFSGTI